MNIIERSGILFITLFLLLFALISNAAERDTEIAVPGALVGESWKVHLKGLFQEASGFKMVSGPSWASLSEDGDLSGTPSLQDVGENRWNITYTNLEPTEMAVTIVTEIVKEHTYVKLRCSIYSTSCKPNGTQCVNQRILETETKPFSPVVGNMDLNVLLPTPFQAYLGVTKLAWGGMFGDKPGYIIQTIVSNRIKPSWQMQEIQLGRITPMKKGTSIRHRITFDVTPNEETLSFLCGLEITAPGEKRAE